MALLRLDIVLKNDTSTLIFSFALMALLRLDIVLKNDTSTLIFLFAGYSLVMNAPL